MNRKLSTNTKYLIIAVAIIAIVAAVTGAWYLTNKAPATSPSPSPTATPSTSGTASPTSPTSSITPASTNPPSSSPQPIGSSTPIPSGTLPSGTSSPAATVSPSTTVVPTSTPVTTTSPLTTPTPSPVASVTAAFDFDTGTPTLLVRQPEPFNQTSNGVTARFSSPFDFPSAFSVQNLQSLATISTVINSTKFSGLFLWPSTINRDPLIINFSRNIVSITFNFKTAELNDPGPGSTGSPIRLSAFLNSVSTPIGSPVTVRGVETQYDRYPEGTLTFSSNGQQFNMVQIDLPTTGASGFIIDNIVVTTA